MKVSYNGLWKILIDKNMNKKELAQVCNLSPATVSNGQRRVCKYGCFVSYRYETQCRFWRYGFDCGEREINEF